MPRGKKNFAARQFFQARKRNPPKLLGPDIFWWGGGLPREGVGAKKFGMSLETQGIKLFWRDIPGFCRDIPEAPEKFEKKNVWVQFLPARQFLPLNCHAVTLTTGAILKKEKSPLLPGERQFPKGPKIEKIQERPRD